jgi:hypothetical protein
MQNAWASEENHEFFDAISSGTDTDHNLNENQTSYNVPNKHTHTEGADPPSSTQ